MSVNSSISMFMLVLSCAVPLSLSVKLKAVQRVREQLCQVCSPLVRVGVLSGLGTLRVLRPGDALCDLETSMQL